MQRDWLAVTSPCAFAALFVLGRGMNLLPVKVIRMQRVSVLSVDSLLTAIG